MKIPRIFHRIWLGPNPITRDHIKYGLNWQSKHLNWEMNLWTEDNIFELQNQEMFDKAKTYSEKSDILRFELLYKYGGVYLDTDIECLKNIEPVINDTDIFVNKDYDNWTEEHPQYLNAAIMGCTPKHPTVKKLIDELPIFAKINKDAHVCWRTGPGFVTVMLRNEDILVPPKLTFHGEYARHYYAGSWKPKEPIPR